MTPPMEPVASNSLKERLDAQYASFNFAESATDPIQIVRRFSDPADREVVGFCAAALAFGRVASVLQSIERLVAIMGPSPADFVRLFDPTRDGRAIRPLVHRWTRGGDLIALLVILRRMLEAGSIEAFFVQGYRPDAADVSDAIESFSTRALAIDVRAAYAGRPSFPGVAYFFPRPSGGSGCKRMNLFLRWMVRKDGVDFGIWSKVPAAKLIVPLDTHVIRVGRCLRLTRSTSPGWKMAAEITASLRALDPDDPVKYDFSLCHLGMADQCGFSRAQGDARCPLRGLCHARPRGVRRRAPGTRRSSARPSARR
jgi:uncharacterized protein (TIGR02757 family)